MAAEDALTSRIIPVSGVSSSDREEMWNLYRRFYAGTDRGLFERDLAQKDSLLLLNDSAGSIQGFSTIALGTT